MIPMIIVTVTPTIPTPMVLTVPVNHREKSEKFNGIDFKMWQKIILFYLTMLTLARFLWRPPVTPVGQ